MKTIEYQGVVRRVLAGRVEVEIRAAFVSASGGQGAQTGRTVLVKRGGRTLRPGDVVLLTETVVEEWLVMLLGFLLPVVVCLAIFFVFQRVSRGDDLLAMTLAAVFLFPYYSILLLINRYLHREHIYSLKQ